MLLSEAHGMAGSVPPTYVLPSSPSRKCLDRFSILSEEHEDESGLVGVWPLLVEILKQDVTNATQLVSVLDTIAASLRGTTGAAGDYGSLKAFLDGRPPSLYESAWPAIVDSALQLPTLFPSGCIPVLRPGCGVTLDRAQARSLVAHQFLCTLDEPSWRDGFHDFSIWYASAQRHPRAVEMYLTALFEFVTQPPTSNGPVRYSLHSFEALERGCRDRDGAALADIRFSRLDTFTTRQQELDYQGPHGAVVVPANRHIGFGQSATQEEVYVGNTPEACPAVLLTPPLDDDEILLVQGAAPTLRIDGQRRNIAWTALPSESRHGGRMLFMDALELDEVDPKDGGLPDLMPENIEREICKAVTAFSSWDGPHRTVSTGLWGCGAFNANPAVKVMLMWAAASIAGVSLEIICDKNTQSEFAGEFEEFAKGMSGARVEALMGALRSLRGDERLLRF